MPVVAGVHHRQVRISELSLHVAEAGEGDPVVMVHGWPQHWYIWRGVIPRLAKRYRVICPDLRGLGWSDAPASGYEKETMASDILRLMDELGLERVKFVGHDWGGLAGFFMCLREPKRVDRFLVMNTGHPWPRVGVRELPSIWRLWYQAVLSAPLLGERVVRSMVDLTYRAGVRQELVSREEWDHYVAQFEERDRARACVQIYRSFLLRELPAAARGRYREDRLKVPTRFLLSEGDPVVQPEMVEQVREHADDFDLEVVPGHGHFLPDEAPDLVADRALAFFD
jgi:pimeloyl-ACP methyl ester carboxylesterase